MPVGPMTITTDRAFRMPVRDLLAPAIAELDVRAIEPDVEPPLDEAVGNDGDVLLVGVTIRDEDVGHDGQGTVSVNGGVLVRADPVELIDLRS